MITIPKAAPLLGVHPHTLRAWIKKGTFPVSVMENAKRKTYRIQESDIEQYLNKST